MTYLLDTNVVSETRRRVPDENVLRWFDGVDQNDLHISVLTLGEIKKGIEKRRKSDLRAAQALDHWLRGLQALFGEHIIPIDSAIALSWGELAARETLPVIDALIAATAKARGLTVASRNVRDLARTGVMVVNPWESARQT